MINEIYSLRDQMVHLGYATGEVDAWIRHVMGDIPVDQLNDQDSIELIDCLNSYILFAKERKTILNICNA